MSLFRLVIYCVDNHVQVTPSLPFSPISLFFALKSVPSDFPSAKTPASPSSQGTELILPSLLLFSQLPDTV